VNCKLRQKLRRKNRPQKKHRKQKKLLLKQKNPLKKFMSIPRKPMSKSISSTTAMKQQTV